MTGVVDALATYRLARLVTADVLTAPLRDRVIEGAYDRANLSLAGEGLDWTKIAVDDEHPPNLAKLVTCRWCSAVWIAAGVVAARRLAPRAWDPVATALALSAVAALLARLEED